MLSSHFNLVAASALIATILAAPITSRQYSGSNETICRPSFHNQSVQIIFDLDTRAGWVPVGNVTKDHSFPAIELDQITGLNTSPNYWIVTTGDQQRGTYTIASTADTDACAAGNGGPIGSSSCVQASGDIQWFITCQGGCGIVSNGEGYGSECTIQSAYEGQCATVTGEGGAVYSVPS